MAMPLEPRLDALFFRSSRDPACVASLALLGGGGTRSQIFWRTVDAEKTRWLFINEFQSHYPSCHLPAIALLSCFIILEPFNTSSFVVAHDIWMAWTWATIGEQVFVGCCLLRVAGGGGEC